MTIFNKQNKFTEMHCSQDLYKAAKLLIQDGEKVLFFPKEKTYQVSKEEVESILLAEQLSEEEGSVMNFLEECDIQLFDWDLDKIVKGEKIRDGYMNVANYHFTLARNPNSYVIVDTIEQGLHPLIVKPLVHQLSQISKGLIITTHHWSLKNDRRLS